MVIVQMSQEPLLRTTNSNYQRVAKAMTSETFFNIDDGGLFYWQRQAKSLIPAVAQQRWKGSEVEG